MILKYGENKLKRSLNSKVINLMTVMKPKIPVENIGILSGDIFMEFQEIIHKFYVTWYPLGHLFQHFKFSKVVENIYSLSEDLGCDVIFNLNTSNDFKIKESAMDVI